MDRSWVEADRRSCEYKLGVTHFCEFASRNARDPRHISCPCLKCGNVEDFSISVIRDHLFVNGIMESYTNWTEHGEAEVVSESDEDTDAIETDEDSSDSVGNNEEVDYGDEDEEVTTAQDEFMELADDANKPLYPGCDRHTKLNVLIRLYNMKAKYSMSDVAFSELLIAFSELLPEGNVMPSTAYKAKKTLTALKLDYTKIDACPNDCVLYRNDHADAKKYPTCGLSRWEVDMHSRPRDGVPAKTLWYFPIIPRFRKMFQSSQTSKSLTWHDTGRKKDGKLRHPADASSWKFVDEKWPVFGADSRNLRLDLSSDGFNPFSGCNNKYSCWHVLLVIYNLPPWLIMKRKHMMLTLLISGPKQPGNDIDVYLQPLIDDLKLLWEGVRGVYDAVENKCFILMAILLWTISDFPALGNLSGSIVHGYNACPICLDNTKPKRLVNGGKMAYIGHRRFLARNHPYRKQKAAFNNLPEHAFAPVPLTGEEKLCRMEAEVPKYLFGKKNGPHKFKDGDEDRPCWKKISCFYQLPYWKFLPVQYTIDVMHIEKNVGESLVGTLLNIPGKTKDGLKTRQDLEEMGIRSELHPNLEASKKHRLPLASWNLSVDEKCSVCTSFLGMRVPSNYSSNISSLVSMGDYRLNGLKSHDYHVLMQQLLPVAIRGVLDKPVRVAVIRLCRFFNEICSKTIDVERLPQIQRDITETLCELEKYFPPSFFDIMVHLTVHLVRQVELCGPVCQVWMYPFERYMKVCKGYVHNRGRPEGCIAERYIAEEAVEFAAETFIDDKTIGIPSPLNMKDSPASGVIVHSVYGELFNQAHLCVLKNTPEFRSYFEEHLDILKKEFPNKVKYGKWLKDQQNKTFASWVKQRVADQLGEVHSTVPEIVRWLADKLSNEVPMFSGYVINGVRYSTRERDDCRRTQNSGVYLVAETPQVASARDQRMITDDMSFYGVITEIWLLDYEKFTFLIFKCDWVDNSRGVKIDELGFTLVNFSKKGHSNDTFVLGRCVEEVFYVKDPIDPSWSVVLKIPCRDYIECEVEDEVDDDVLAHCPTSIMPSIELAGNLVNEGEVNYRREGEEDIVVVG